MVFAKAIVRIDSLSGQIRSLPKTDQCAKLYKGTFFIIFSLFYKRVLIRR